MEPEISSDKTSPRRSPDGRRTGFTDRKLSPAREAAEKAFLDGAHKALSDAGTSALRFLAANPSISLIQLAQLLNRGVTAFGLRMAIYHEAAIFGCVRAIASDLLVREINAEFPNGWISHVKPDALSRLGGWRAVRTCGNDPATEEYIRCIRRDIAIENPPPDGWKPQSKDDPFILALFDRLWPVLTENSPDSMNSQSQPNRSNASERIE